MAVKLKPSVVLTDASMPLLNGLDAVQILTGMGLRTKFIVLTMHADISLAVRVFRAGASAFVLKSASSDELKEAIKVVQDGGCYLSPQISHRPGQRSRRGCSPTHGRQGSATYCLVSARCCNSSLRERP